MKIKQILYLTIALIVPVAFFLFLKSFGKNEFAVPPLYQNTKPEIKSGCSPVSIPYQVPDSIMQQFALQKDSLIVLVFNNAEKDSGELQRVKASFVNDPIRVEDISPNTVKAETWRKCIFFLENPFDVVLVDRAGALRGHYVSTDREDVDRLITEITIILKKY